MSFYCAVFPPYPPPMRPFFVLLVFALPPFAAAQPAAHPFTFSSVRSDLPDTRFALAAWADVDGDGDLDLFLAGLERGAGDGSLVPRAHLFRNDGAAADANAPGGRRPRFTDTAAGLAGLAYGQAAWGDFDRDGDLDLVVTGSATLGPPYTPRTVLYRNEAGTLAETAIALPQLHSGTVDWADVDGDGDLDLLVTGTRDAEAPYRGETHLLRNTDGRFDEIETALPGLVFGDITWHDLTGDGRPDVFLTGLTPGGVETRLYHDENGAYALQFAQRGVLFGQTDAAPSADGQPRRVVTGARPGPRYFEGSTETTLYADLPQLYGGGVSLGDLDGDGDLDVSLSGRPALYRNNQHVVFEAKDWGGLVEKNLLFGTIGGPLQFVDYDADGDLDLFAAGDTTRLYRNERPLPLGLPDTPFFPEGLSAEPAPGGVLLRWEPSARAGVSYDVWVGTAPGQADRAAPPALLASGQRLLPAGGAIGAEAQASLHLPPGRYYWGVQAISGERVGSAFAMGAPFTVGAATGVGAEASTALGLAPPRPSPFGDQTHLTYSLPAATTVTLAVYDVQGRRVRLLAGGSQPAGTHTLAWPGDDDAGHPLASGLYLLRLETPRAHLVRTVLIAR